MNSELERKFVFGVLLILTIILSFLAFTATGTGDEGDSIMHYLFSRTAFDHTENFLNHWAKPVFVLFTAPIAQGGFIAMKLFNVAMLIGTLWLTWRVAKELKVPNAWAVIFPVIFSVMSFSHTLSGLTEPMFAFWMMTGIYLLIKNHSTSAVLWMSFLPFVRSEGLIIFCVLVIYLFLKKQWKLIPLLGFGHVFYSLIGFFHYNDFLWVFNKMTYATTVSAYGSGPLMHFVNRLPEVMGDILPVFLLVGVLIGGVRILQYWFAESEFSKEELWLVYGIAVAYFIAHSLFWFLGIFNSFGLTRVMIGVLPLFGIIIIQGINFISGIWTKNNLIKNGILVSSLAIMAIFFLANLSYKKNLSFNDSQLCQSTLAEKYAKNYPGYTVYFDAIHPALAFDKDWFNPNEHRMIGQLFSGEPIPEKSIAVWDNWFAVTEGKVSLEQMRADPRLKEIECVTINSASSCLFEFDTAFAEKSVVFNADFEEPKYKEHSDTTYSKSGNYSLKLGSERQFSPSFEGWINSFSVKNKPRIKLSFWAFLPPETKEESTAQAVLSFESELNSFEYHNLKVFDQNDRKGVWKYVELEKSVPDYKIFRDKVKAYVWNPGKSSIFIDDLKVEWFESDVPE